MNGMNKYRAMKARMDEHQGLIRRKVKWGENDRHIDQHNLILFAWLRHLADYPHQFFLKWKERRVPR